MLQLGTVDVAVSGKNQGSTLSQITRVHENTASFMPLEGCSMNAGLGLSEQLLQVLPSDPRPFTLHFLRPPSGLGLSLGTSVIL